MSYASSSGYDHNTANAACNPLVGQVGQYLNNPVLQTPNGLMLDAGTIMARLGDIRDRVAKLNDRLNGYRPSDTGATPPQEPDTFRRLFDRSIELLNSIDVEMNIIEAKI